MANKSASTSSMDRNRKKFRFLFDFLFAMARPFHVSFELSARCSLYTKKTRLSLAVGNKIEHVFFVGYVRIGIRHAAYDNTLCDRRLIGNVDGMRDSGQYNPH